jgi:hypothetical protein
VPRSPESRAPPDRLRDARPVAGHEVTRASGAWSRAAAPSRPRRRRMPVTARSRNPRPRRPGSATGRGPGFQRRCSATGSRGMARRLKRPLGMLTTSHGNVPTTLAPTAAATPPNAAGHPMRGARSSKPSAIVTTTQRKSSSDQERNARRQAEQCPPPFLAPAPPADQRPDREAHGLEQQELTGAGIQPRRQEDAEEQEDRDRERARHRVLTAAKGDATEPIRAENGSAHRRTPVPPVWPRGWSRRSRRREQPGRHP